MKKTILLPAVLILLALVTAAVVLIGPAEKPLARMPPAVEGAKASSTSATTDRRDLAPSVPSSVDGSASRSAVTVTTGLSVAPGAPGSSGQVEAADPAVLEEKREAKEQAIWDAAYTFSPEGLKVLAPFLNDSDPAVREAAIEGIEQLASPEGIAVLRSAIPRARNEKERRRLIEAAEWLALPEWQGSR